jgi:hypothetical protein
MRRPLHTLTALATVAHHGYELLSGVGLVFQPYLGMPGAAALWSGTLPAWAWVAARGSHRWDRPLAYAAGMAVGGAAMHYLLWPWEIRRGLPTLIEAEGLRPEQLPAYNVILWGWAASALGALVRETPRGARRWALAGVLTALPLRRSAIHHFRWIREEAIANPAWWNRALRPAT